MLLLARGGAGRRRAGSMAAQASSSSRRTPKKGGRGGGFGGGSAPPTPPAPQAPPPPPSEAADAKQPQQKPKPNQKRTTRLEEVRRRNASLRAAIGMVIAADSVTTTAAAPPPPPAPAPAPAATPAPRPPPQALTGTLGIVCVSTADPASPTGAEDLASALAARGHRVAVVAPQSPRHRDDNTDGEAPWLLVPPGGNSNNWQEALAQAREKVAAADRSTLLALDWRAAALLEGPNPPVVALLEGAATNGPVPASLAAARAVLAPSPLHAAELVASPVYQQAFGSRPPVRGVIGGLGLPRALARAWDPLSDPFLGDQDGGAFDPRTERGLGWDGRARHQEALRREVGLRLPPGLLEAAVAAAEGAEAASAAANDDEDDDENDDPFALPKELLKQFEEAAVQSLDDDADAGDEVRAGARSAQAPMLLAVPCRLSSKDGQGGLAAEVLVDALPRLVGRGVQVVVVAVLAAADGDAGQADNDGDNEPALASAWAGALAAATRGLPPRPQAPSPPRHSAARRLLEASRRDFPESVRVLFAAEGGRTAARLMHLAFAGADAVLVLPPAEGGGDEAPPPPPPPLRPEFALPSRGALGSLAHLAMRYGALPLAYGGAGAGIDDCRAGGVADYGSLVRGDDECGGGFLYFGGDSEEEEEGGEGGSSSAGVSPLSSYAGSSTDEEEEGEEEGEEVEGVAAERAPRAAVQAAARAIAARAAEASRVLRRRPRRWRAMQMRAASAALDGEVDRRAWERAGAACEGLLRRR